MRTPTVDGSKLRVMVMRTCPECGGSGLAAGTPYCRECGQPVGHEAIRNMANVDTMPCGHPWEWLTEEEPCSNCEGRGEVTGWATLDELADAMLDYYQRLLDERGQRYGTVITREDVVDSLREAMAAVEHGEDE